MSGNPRRAAFVREYLRDFNGTAAAIRAGYSTNTARAQASRLLGYVDVQAAIQEAVAAANVAGVMEYAEACERLTRAARATLADYLRADGTVDPEAVIGKPEGVVSLDVLADGTIRLRLADRIRALERLAKLRGWDQPARVQSEDVTPPRYDLSRLTDDELAAFEVLLARVAPT